MAPVRPGRLLLAATAAVYFGGTGRDAPEAVNALDRAQIVWMALGAALAAARLVVLARRPTDLLTEKQVRFLLLGVTVGAPSPRPPESRAPPSRGLDSDSLVARGPARSRSFRPPSSRRSRGTGSGTWRCSAARPRPLLGALLVGAGFFALAQILLAHPVAVGIPHAKGALAGVRRPSHGAQLRARAAGPLRCVPAPSVPREPGATARGCSRSCASSRRRARSGSSRTLLARAHHAGPRRLARGPPARGGGRARRARRGRRPAASARGASRRGPPRTDAPLAAGLRGAADGRGLAPPARRIPHARAADRLGAPSRALRRGRPRGTRAAVARRHGASRNRPRAGGARARPRAPLRRAARSRPTATGRSSGFTRTSSRARPRRSPPRTTRGGSRPSTPRSPLSSGATRRLSSGRRRGGRAARRARGRRAARRSSRRISARGRGS